MEFSLWGFLDDAVFMQLLNTQESYFLTDDCEAYKDGEERDKKAVSGSSTNHILIL